jgi:hypothetical protein
MATKTVTYLEDDLDGTRGSDDTPIETVPFALDGEVYEIDLHTANATKLRNALAKWVAAARKATASRGRTATTAKSGGKVARAAVDREQNKAIRDWAKAHGYPTSDRGRIPMEVVDAYHLGGNAANDAMAKIVAARSSAVQAELPTTNGQAHESVPEPAQA